MLKNLNYYKLACVATAFLYFFLFYTLQFEPEKLCSDLGLEGNDIAYLFLRRASILMLGFGVLLFLGRNVDELKSKYVVSISVAVCMLGLALMSALEFVKGNLSNEVIGPLVIESIVGTIFMLLAISNRTKKST